MTELAQKVYRVLLREVTQAECRWLDRTLTEGEELEVSTAYTYGCVSYDGVAMEELGGSSFFEVPWTALGPPVVHTPSSLRSPL